MPHVHLHREIDLDEIIRPFARLHLRDLRRMELTNIQTPRKGDLGPGLKSIKLPRGARILINNCSPPPPHTECPIRKYSSIPGGTEKGMVFKQFYTLGYGR